MMTDCIGGALCWRQTLCSVVVITFPMGTPPTAIILGNADRLSSTTCSEPPLQCGGSLCGSNYPEPKSIMAAAYSGLPFDKMRVGNLGEP